MTVAAKTAVNYSYLTDLIGHLAGLTHLRATQLCTVELADIGLTPKQFVALEFIANNPNISQKEIAEHIGTTPTVLVNVLDVMTERDLLMRVRSLEDRRRHSVVLTEKGEALRKRVRVAAYAVEDQLQLESGLDAQEWHQLQKLMQKLAQRSED
ncbi:MAG: MarR family transcriptional regulator [Chloroflexota bacterium]